MKFRKSIFSLFVLAAATSSQAAEWVDFNDFRSTKSRAEVNAELNRDRANGSYVAGSIEFQAPDVKFTSTKSRAEVIAELEQSKADGSYAVAHQQFEGQYGLPSGRPSMTARR